MNYEHASAISQAKAPEKKGKFPSLRLESGNLGIKLKERLQSFLFRNGYFDIYDSALGLAGLKTRYPTTVSTPEDLSREGRKKVVAALQQMVEQGEATLRGLVDGKFIKPEAPIGYWDDKENARFWVARLLDSKMELAGLADAEKKAVELARGGAGLDYWQEQQLAKAQRKAFSILKNSDFTECGLSGLIQKPYDGKIHLIASDLYPHLGMQPWQLSSTPKNYFEKKENRIAAIHWVAFMRRKKPEEYSSEERRVAQLHEKDLTMMDLEDWRTWNCLREKDPLALVTDDLKRFGIAKIMDHVKGEHKLAQLVCEAYPKRDYRVWQMKHGIKGYFSHPELGSARRVEAIRHTAERLKKSIRQLTREDLDSQSSEILNSYPASALIFAMWEADHSITLENFGRRLQLRTVELFEEWRRQQAA